VPPILVNEEKNTKSQFIQNGTLSNKSYTSNTEKEFSSSLDKASILHEIKQLQMLHPTTATRDLSLKDSYETLQLALLQARQPVDIFFGNKYYANDAKYDSYDDERCELINCFL